MKNLLIIPVALLLFLIVEPAVAGTNGRIHSLERTTIGSADSAPLSRGVLGKFRPKRAFHSKKLTSPGGLGLTASIIGSIFLGIGVFSLGTTIGGLMLILGTGLAITAVVLGIISIFRNRNNPGLDRKSGVIGLFIATAPFTLLFSWLIYILIINPFG